MGTQHKLGILGGMGPQATVDFYQSIIHHSVATCDQDYLETIIYSDTQMPDRTVAILSGDTEPTYQRLLAGAKMLEQNGCTAIAVPCNTAHYFLDRVQTQIQIPIVHMIRETANVLHQNGVQRTAILGTDGAIQAGLFQTACASIGIEAIVPPEHLQKSLMSLIYDDLKTGKSGTMAQFAPIAQWAEEQGCGCAILACTELSTFRIYHNLPAFYVDAMEVLAEISLRTCGREPKPIER